MNNFMGNNGRTNILVNVSIYWRPSPGQSSVRRAAETAAIRIRAELTEQQLSVHLVIKLMLDAVQGGRGRGS